MAFICPDCQNQIPLESLLRELIVCQEGVSYLRVIETEDQLGECITCGHDIPLESIGRDAIYCDENGVKYLQVKLYSGVETSGCVTCLRGIPLSGLLRSLFGCDESGEPWVRLLSVGAEPPVELALKLTYDDIVNVPVESATSLANWNNFFDLPFNGGEFTSVVVNGNTVELYGGAGITLSDNLFDDEAGSGTHLIKFEDEAGCIIHAGYDVFGDDYYSGCKNVTVLTIPNLLTAGISCFQAMKVDSFSFPDCTTFGNRCFTGCNDATSYNLSGCLYLGEDTGNNSVFLGNPGRTLSLTIPSALMTCHTGDPDGDIQYLQANNTVTIVTV